MDRVMTLEDFKRAFPNYNIENLQGTNIGNLQNIQVIVADESQNSQQQTIYLPEEPSLVLNDGHIQQLVAYQQPTQNIQTFIIQSTENDNCQQAGSVGQQPIYYSTEVASDQLMQQQQVQQQQHQQQQQQQAINIAHQVQHDASQQQEIILQKPHASNQQQLIQQSMANQSNTHQHVIMQQTPHIVLQQQAPPQQHQQQDNNQIVIRPMQTNTMSQPRYVYQQPQQRTVVYNAQPQAALQTNHQQHVQQQQQHLHQQQQSTASTQNRVGLSQQAQPSRQLIITSQPQMQSNLIYQSPQTQQQQQQGTQVNLLQQKRLVDNAAGASRIVRFTTPRVSLVSQNVAPKLSPFRAATTTLRFQSPQVNASSQASTPSPVSSSSSTTSEVMTPPQTTPVVKQAAPRRTNTGGKARATSTPRTPRAAMAGRAGTMVTQALQQPQQQVRTMQVQQTPTSTMAPQQPQTQATPPLVRQGLPPLVSTPIQRTLNSAITTNAAATPKGVLAGGQMAQRVIATQTMRTPSPGAGQTGQQISMKYRPRLTNPGDLEESIQAVVVTKSCEQSTNTVTTNEANLAKTFQTTVTTYSTIDSPDEDKKAARTVNGRVYSLTDFKRQHPKLQQAQQAATTILNRNPSLINRAAPTTINRPAGSTIVASPSVGIQRNTVQQTVATDESKKVIRNPVSQPQNQHIIPPVTNNKLQNPTGDTQKSARMLVILSNGEQRLITFTLPRESCTVQELLEQVGVPFTPKTSIQCVPNPGANIDYIVTVGITVQESPTELATAAENSLQLSKLQQEQQSVEAQASTTITAHAAGQQANTTIATVEKSEAAKEIPPKFYPGYLAVCTLCGYTGNDFAKCERCKRVFTEEPKRIASKVAIKADDEKKKTATTQAELLNRAGKSPLTVPASALSQIRGGRLTISTSAASRGRGRGLVRSKPAEEPVILTLSSDDEGDEEKSNKPTKVPAVPSVPMTLKPPLPCEPVITDNMPAPPDFVRQAIEVGTNTTDQLYTHVTCKVIRIGTYKYEPKEKVLLTTNGIRIVAPSCKNPAEMVVLHIKIHEIVKIVAHFSKSLNILFMYMLPSCGAYVRESLEMKAKSADNPYYSPTDRVDSYKRIILQMESIPEEAKTVIRSLYTKGTLEEIGCGDANELLVRSCTKDKYIKQDASATVKIEPDIRQILIYPPGKGGMPINTEDYMCLAIDQYLNDVIIDFFLKYLHLNVLDEEQRQKTHIFSSFFYNRLTTMTTRQRQSEKDVKLTASQKRHARVKSWTKNVNLFEKDFIIIPINEQSHWFLAIICFPRLKGPVTYDTHEPVVNQPTVKKKKPAGERKVSLQIGNTTITPLTKRELDSAVCVADDSLSERDEAEGDESDLASDESDTETPNGNTTNSAPPNDSPPQHRAIKQPLILIFDSLAGASRSRVVATLRDYLTCEYRSKIKEDSVHTFNKYNMPGHCVKVPQQNNFTDCGLYVLQYVEQFFKDPILDYKLPIKQLVNWFETIVVTRKREEISMLLKDLVEKHNPDRLPLPEILFPTLDGKLLETEMTDEQAEFEEEEMDDEGEEEEDEEMESLAEGDTEGESTSPVKRNGGKQTAVKKSIATTTPTPTPSPTPTTITLKRPLSSSPLNKSQESIVRKTARLNESI